MQDKKKNTARKLSPLLDLFLFFSFECKWIHRLEKEYRGWSGDSHKLGSRRQEHLQACRKRKCEWLMLNSGEDGLRNRQCSLVLTPPRNMWCHQPWMETGAAHQPECSRSNRKKKQECCSRPDSWTDSSLTTSWQPRTAPGLFTPFFCCPKTEKCDRQTARTPGHNVGSQHFCRPQIRPRLIFVLQSHYKVISHLSQMEVEFLHLSLTVWLRKSDNLHLRSWWPK